MLGLKLKVLVEYDKCIGCKACEVACEYYNQTNRVYVYEFYDRGISIPVICRHCEKAPCIRVCPERALYRDDDGFVVLDDSKCIGCLMCATACPFGAISLDALKGVIIKCDMCASRRKEGLPPACVTACPTNAIKVVEPKVISEYKRKKVAEKIALLRAFGGV